MSTLTRVELDRSLAAGRVQPLYLLIGTESYLRDTAARNITAAALSGTSCASLTNPFSASC